MAAAVREILLEVFKDEERLLERVAVVIISAHVGDIDRASGLSVVSE
jgi:hypothetical protein